MIATGLNNIVWHLIFMSRNSGGVLLKGKYELIIDFCGISVTLPRVRFEQTMNNIKTKFTSLNHISNWQVMTIKVWHLQWYTLKI